MKVPALTPPVPTAPAPTDADIDVATLIERAQHKAFDFFEATTDPASGLVLDSTQPDSPCSITGLGMALTAYPIAVERGWMTRQQAMGITLRTLRFLVEADMSGSPDSSGHRGFYFHFLDMATGRRAWKSELSSIDTAFLVAGVLAVAAYFDHDTGHEAEIRQTARHLERPRRLGLDVQLRRRHLPRLEARARLPALPLGRLQRGAADVRPRARLPTPPRPHRRPGTNGSRATAGAASTATSTWPRAPCSSTSTRTCGSTSAASRTRSCASNGIDYFENSRRATLVQREYAIRNPKHFHHYCQNCWGLTACDGPGPRDRRWTAASAACWATRRAGRPYGPGRRHRGAVGLGRLAAVRARRRHPDHAAHRAHGAQASALHARLLVQPDLGRTARARPAGSRRGASPSTAGRWCR